MNMGDRVRISKTYIKHVCKHKQQYQHLHWQPHLEWIGNRVGIIEKLGLGYIHVRWDNAVNHNSYTEKELELVP